jgi:hypothetical protein
MSPLAIALVAFVCVFGGALLGMLLCRVLPEQHLSSDTKDLIKLVTGLIATLAALVLGLLIASAKNSFDLANDGLRTSAARIVLLDRTLAQYGPETKPLRDALRTSMAARISELFPKDPSQRAALGAIQGTQALEAFQREVRALVPQNDAQRSLQPRALALVDEVSQARWLAVEREGSSIPAPFLVVLLFWLTVMFASFGLFAPRNAVVYTVLLLGALSLATAVFLIEELNNPLGGFISIPSEPLYKALDYLGK